MYIESIQVESIRCLRSASTEFGLPESEGRAPNVTLLLGNNGAGKTSVLKSIALAALAPIITGSSGFTPYSLVRRTKKGPEPAAHVRGRFVFHEQDEHTGTETLEVEVRPTRSSYHDRFEHQPSPKWTEAMYDERSPAFFLLGYGASRRVDTDVTNAKSMLKSRVLRYQRVAGLFEEQVMLIPLNAWLADWKKANPGRHKQVVNLINRLLPDGCDMLPEPREGEYLFRVGHAELPQKALSDGYRAYVGWVGDMLYHVCMGCPTGMKLVDNRGIVLIDEIDLHLHPDWQQSVVTRLAKTLPKLQFILTTHSPLVVGTIPSENIRVLRGGADGTRIEEPDFTSYGRSVDQILTSSAFGLESPRDLEFTESLQSVAAEARDGDPGASLHLMRMLSEGGSALLDTERSSSASATKAKPRKKPKTRRTTRRRPKGDDLP